MRHEASRVDLTTLPWPLPASGFTLSSGDGCGNLQGYAEGLDTAGSHPLLLIHSVNAAASAYEVRPLFTHYSASRPTYAFDLPGFGLSDRTPQRYTPRRMTDAVHAMAREIGGRHDGARVDALALSLSCEFLARAVVERPSAFRKIALVSPTGFTGTRRRTGISGSTRAVPGMRAVLGLPLWDDALFNTLTRPSVIRYFLRRTWGSTEIDEGLWAYAARAARQPGAKFAPLDFLSGELFSNDVNLLYDALDLPVWVAHGVRGDFVDYRGLETMRSRGNWRFSVFPTGALPHFELPDDFTAAYGDFLTSD